jgi:hypothetical protein
VPEIMQEDVVHNITEVTFSRVIYIDRYVILRELLDYIVTCRMVRVTNNYE